MKIRCLSKCVVVQAFTGVTINQTEAFNKCEDPELQRRLKIWTSSDLHFGMHLRFCVFSQSSNSSIIAISVLVN